MIDSTVNSPKYMIGAHQTSLRTTTPDQKINIAVFDKRDLRKYYVEIDGQKYPRDGISINYTKNDYIDRYKDLKLFFKEYIGEQLLKPNISHPDMKTNYPIDIIDLRHQLDDITPKKFNFFKSTALILRMLDCF